VKILEFLSLLWTVQKSVQRQSSLNKNTERKDNGLVRPKKIMTIPKSKNAGQIIAEAVVAQV